METCSQSNLTDDFTFGKSLRTKVEAIFAEREGTAQFVDYEFKDYKGQSFCCVGSQKVFTHAISGTTHGFAARPNLSLPDIMEAHEKAFEQTVEWLQKTLSV